MILMINPEVKITGNSGSMEWMTPETKQLTNIGILQINGALMPKPDWIEQMHGCVDIMELQSMFQMLEDNCENIVLDINSPGGSDIGLYEFAQMINQSKRNVIAYVDNQCCSSAYVLAAACNEIVATPSARIGAIGSYIRVEKDPEMQSKTTYYHRQTGKIYGASDSPSTVEEANYFNGLVEQAFNVFVDTISQLRGINKQVILDTNSLVLSAKDYPQFVDQIVMPNQAINYIMNKCKKQ